MDTKINNSGFSVPGDDTPEKIVPQTSEQKAEQILEGIKDSIGLVTDSLIFYPFDPLLQLELKLIDPSLNIQRKVVQAIISAKTIAYEATELKQEIPGLIMAIPKTTARLARTMKEVFLHRIRETLQDISTIPQKINTLGEEIHQHGIVEVLDRNDATIT